MKLHADKQISKFGLKLLLECLACPGDLGNKPAIVIYMEGIIKFTKLRPGDRNKGPPSLQVVLIARSQIQLELWQLRASTGNNPEIFRYNLNLPFEQKFVPLSIGKKIFDNFGSGEQKNLVTPEMQDKAICYVIVLGKTLQ